MVDGTDTIVEEGVNLWEDNQLEKPDTGTTDQTPDQTPPVEADEKPAEGDEKPDWDKKRQEKDQLNATERQEQAAQIRSMQENINVLTAQMTKQDASENVLKVIAEKLSASTASTPSAKKSQLDEILEQIEQTSEDDVEVGTLLATIRELTKTAKGRDAAFDELKQQMADNNAEFTKRLDDQHKETEDQKRIQDGKDSQTRMTKHLVDLEKRLVGGKQMYRNEVISKTRELMQDEGYTQTNLPPESTVTVAFTLFYERAASDAAKASKAGTTVMDTLNGGTLASGQKQGSMQDVLADMKAKGKL